MLAFKHLSHPSKHLRLLVYVGDAVKGALHVGTVAHWQWGSERCEGGDVGNVAKCWENRAVRLVLLAMLVAKLLDVHHR